LSSIYFLRLADIFVLTICLIPEYQVFSLLSIPLPRQHDYPSRYLIRNDRLLIDRLDALVLVTKSPTVIYTAIHNGNPGNIAADISNLAQTPPAGMGPPMRTILLRCGNIFSSGICVQFDDVGGLR
jgi:hypothetical protein